MQKIIRIKKEFSCAQHSIRLSSGEERTFLKGKSYDTADPEVIRICEGTRTHFENPKSPLLFDILSPDEAEELVRAEKQAAEPNATLDDPISLDGKQRAKRQPSVDPKVIERFRSEIEKAGQGLERFVDGAKADLTTALDEAKAILESVKALSLTVAERAEQATHDRDAAVAALKAASAEREEASKLLEQATKPADPAAPPEKAAKEPKPKTEKADKA